MNTSTKHVHVYLANLIKETFGVFLEIEHNRYDGNGYPVIKHTPVTASTHVYAFRSLEDARDWRNVVASATAKCVKGDRFVRAKGLEIALRRLYRDLADMRKAGEI